MIDVPCGHLSHRVLHYFFFSDYHQYYYAQGAAKSQEHVTGGYFTTTANVEITNTQVGIFYWCPHHQNVNLGTTIITTNKGSRSDIFVYHENNTGILELAQGSNSAYSDLRGATTMGIFINRSHQENWTDTRTGSR